MIRSSSSRSSGQLADRVAACAPSGARPCRCARRSGRRTARRRGPIPAPLARARPSPRGTASSRGSPCRRWARRSTRRPAPEAGRRRRGSRSRSRGGRRPAAPGTWPCARAGRRRSSPSRRASSTSSHPSRGWSRGTCSGVALISCRQRTSGCSRATHSATCACRARMPFTFQVAIFSMAEIPNSNDSREGVGSLTWEPTIGTAGPSNSLTTVEEPCPTCVMRSVPCAPLPSFRPSPCCRWRSASVRTPPSSPCSTA